MKKKLFFVIVLIAIIVVAAIGIVKIAFLKSPEEKVITKLEKLTERVEKDGANFDYEEWKNVINEITAIHDEMENCDFDSEQLKAVGKAEGQLTAAITKQASQQLEQGISSALMKAGAFMEGFLQGIDGVEIKESGDGLTNALKALEEKLK